MGLFDGGDIAATLARLVQSPRVQYGADQLKRAFPQASGPLRTNNQFSGGGGTGASPRIGQILSQFSNELGGQLRGTGGQLGGIAARMTPQPQDPLMNLYQQLVDQLEQPVNMPTGINTEDLMKQVRDAIDPIYNQRSQAAKDQSSRARADVQGMYGALADDYERLAPQQIEQAKAAQEEIKALYGQLRSNVEGSYSRVSEEQSDLFKQLGIEAALPEVLQEQAAPVTESLTAASENQAQQQQRYMDIGQMDSTFYREGSPNATMRGNEVSTDMLAQLQDYLNQVEAERTSGIQTAYMDQYNQAQSQLGQQQQLAQTEAARRQEMLWQMLQGQLQSSPQQKALTPDSFMGQLPPETQQSIAGAFTQLQRSPEAVYGKVEDPRNPVPGTFVETTPQWYMSQADEMLRRGEIDAVTHQALQMYMSLYFGSGK